MPPALYDAIIDFVARPGAVRMKMGTYSRQRVQELFAWRTNAHRFAALFAEVAARGSKP